MIFTRRVLAVRFCVGRWFCVGRHDSCLCRSGRLVVCNTRKPTASTPRSRAPHRDAYLTHYLFLRRRFDAGSDEFCPSPPSPPSAFPPASAGAGLPASSPPPPSAFFSASFAIMTCKNDPSFANWPVAPFSASSGAISTCTSGRLSLSLPVSPCFVSELLPLPLPALPAFWAAACCLARLSASLRRRRFSAPAVGSKSQCQQQEQGAGVQAACMHAGQHARLRVRSSVFFLFTATRFANSWSLIRFSQSSSIFFRR